MNVVCLVGRLTADPELRQTPNGTNVCAFSVAVNRQFTDSNGERQADFINCVAWRQTAEFITKYFRKGQHIGLNGTIQTRQFQDKDTGKNRTAFEVVINNAYFVESKGSGNGQAQQKPSPEIAYTAPAPAPAAAYQPQQQSFEPQKQAKYATALDDFSNIASDDGDLPF